MNPKIIDVVGALLAPKDAYLQNAECLDNTITVEVIYDRPSDRVTLKSLQPLLRGQNFILRVERVEFGQAIYMYTFVTAESYCDGDELTLRQTLRDRHPESMID